MKHPNVKERIFGWSLQTLEKTYLSAKRQFEQWNKKLSSKKGRGEKPSAQEKGEYALARIQYKALWSARSVLNRKANPSTRKHMDMLTTIPEEDDNSELEGVSDRSVNDDDTMSLSTDSDWSFD